jgi:hypothetical protein
MNSIKVAVNGYSNMKCSCCQAVSFDKAFESHFSNCSSFQLQFGELLNALVNTIKKIKDKNDYNLIKYMFHVQKFQIRRVLKQVKTEVEQHNPYLANAVLPVPEHNYEEEKIKKLAASMVEPRNVPAVQIFIEEKTLIMCTECKWQFPDMNNMVVLSCGHNYCHGCMKHKAFKELAETGQLFCNCKAAVKEIEMKVI